VTGASRFLIGLAGSSDISNPEPLVPGEPVTLRFSLTPHPVVVKKVNSSA
jgi:hypothetical protein